jgi:O-antigen ligase
VITGAEVRLSPIVIPFSRASPVELAGGGPAALRSVMATIVETQAARVARVRRFRAPTPRDSAGLAVGALLLVPAALTVHQSFNAGGYFVGAPSLAAAVLALALALRLLLADQPFAGLTLATRVCAGALALLAVWTLASAAWSHSPSRAVLAFDRTLLYLLAFVTAGTLLRTEARLQWAVRGFAVAAAVVCGVGLATRLAPDAFPIAPGAAAERLSFPLTYWNALGLLAAVALVLCLHLTASEREPRLARVLAAAACPVLATTLYFTFSRGALAAGAVGLVVYLAVGRPRHIAGALLAVVPATAAAVAVAWGANLLATSDPTSSAATSQGHRVGLVLVLCAAAAGLVRQLATPLDTRLVAWSTGRRPATRKLAAAGAAAAIVAALALHVPGTIQTQYHHFVDGKQARAGSDLRSRFGDAASPERLAQWRVATAAFRERPLTGFGAGTYDIRWNRNRPDNSDVVHAHSLYLQALAELGVPGLAALAVALLALLGGLARRARGSQRPLYAALLAVGVAWALHAAVDWDWEMPAVTAWLFALGGIALAAPAVAVRRQSGVLGVHTVGARRTWSPRPATRIALALGALLLAITPALAALSQVRLDAGVAALRSGNCGRAIDQGLAAASVMPARPEPWEVIGYCDARLGHSALAERAFDNAIRLDGDNWQLHYGLALVRAAAAVDPRPAAREALRLNPRGVLPRDAVRRFATSSPATWRAHARSAPFALQ